MIRNEFFLSSREPTRPGMQPPVNLNLNLGKICYAKTRYCTPLTGSEWLEWHEWLVKSYLLDPLCCDTCNFHVTHDLMWAVQHVIH